MRVHFHVELGDTQLAHILVRGEEEAHFLHLLQIIIRYAFAGLVMGGKGAHTLGLPSPVLIHLAGQFYKVPCHTRAAV